MPVYQYEGKHYELPDGLSPAEAIQKIQAHLGKAEKPATPGLLDMAGGVAETLTTGALDAFGGIGAGVYGSVKGALTPGKTASQGFEEAGKSYEDSTFHKLMMPQTETGKNIAEFIGKGVEGFKEEAANKAEELNASDKPDWLKTLGTANYALMSTAPEFLMVAGARGPGSKKEAIAPKPQSKAAAYAAEQAAKEAEKVNPTPPADRPTMPVTPEGQGVLSSQDMLFKQEAERKAGLVAAARPVEGRNLNDPFGQMKQQLDTPQALPPEPSPVMGQMVDNLQKKGTATPEQSLAQRSIEERQAAMEQQVKQTTTLEMNAAERARQEAAPVPGLYESRMRELAEQQKAALERSQEAAMQKRTADAFAEMEKANELAERQERAVRAQEAIRRRAEHMEQEVKQRTTLEYNAAERARQEKAEVPGLAAARETNRYAEAQKAVDQSPLVMRAEERAKMAEEAYIKAADALQQGAPHMTEKILKRLERDMKEMQESLAWVKSNVLDSTLKGEKPSKKVEDSGMYKNGVKKVQIKPGGPGGRQGGWILLERPSKDGVLKDIPGIVKHLGNIANHFYKNPREVIDAALKSKDMDTNVVFDQLTKGGQYQKLKTDNPIIHYAVDEMMKADRVTRADIRDQVHDKLGASFREVKTKEQAEMWALISDADLKQKSLDVEAMARHGFSEEAIRAVENHRSVMDYAYNMINTALEAMGKKPIDKRTAYAAMRSTGDFRRLVYEIKDGEKVPVGIIGSNWRWRTNQLAEQMKAKGYEIGDEKYMGGVPRERGSAHEAFMHAIEFLAENDPKVQGFIDALNDIRTTEVYNFLNMKTHTMEKKGIFGMEGRKPWKDMEANAKEGLQQQMRFAESAIRWGHTSEAVTKIKEVIDSPELAGKHERASKWAEDYIYNALGFNPSQIGRGLEQAVANIFRAPVIADTVGGYSNIRSVMAGARSTVNTALLSLNPMFWSTQFIQPFQNMPGMKASLIAKGLDAGFDFGTGWSYLGKGAITAYKQQLGVKLSPLEVAAKKWASDNHVYGSDLIEHSNRVRKDIPYMASQLTNIGTGALESSTRRATFYGLVHMLAENGMKQEHGLFEAAAQLTDMTMVNYSAIERPKVYNHLGPLGDLAINLQNYKHNELSRLAYFARQIGNDKSLRPLAVQLASSVAFAGMMGIVGYNVADQAYKLITKAMGNPDSLNALVLRGSEAAGAKMNELTGGKMGDWSHVLAKGGPALIGLDMSKRLGMGDVVPEGLDIMFPGGSKLGKMVSSTYEFGKMRTEQSAKRMAREFSPGMLTGIEDRAWFSKNVDGQELALNRENNKATAIRNDKDKIWKTLGGTGTNEVVQRDKKYEAQWVDQAYMDLRKKSLDRMRDTILTKGKVDDDDVRDYIRYQGDDKTLVKDIKKFYTEQQIPEYQMQMLKGSASKSIARIKQAQRLLELYKK